MRKNHGITLIALVITIIVLLILAGVSISAITGENGIVEKAKAAKDATRVASIEERIVLFQSENNMLEAEGEETKTITEFIDELEKDGTITSEEKAEILEKHTLTVGNQEPIVFPFGKTLVQAFKDGEIQIGDYVKYTPSDLDATVELTAKEIGWSADNTYSVDSDVTWRVLGLNEDGTELLITTGSPIRGERTYLGLQGFEGFYNCVNTLNKISSIYHNNELASETRSINIEDINNALGIVVENDVVYKKDDETKTNIDTYGSLGLTHIYEVGDYAPENYLKEYYTNDEEYQKLESKKAGDIVNATAYCYSYLDENIINPNSALYDVLFAGTTEEEKYAKSYWLASQSIYVPSSNPSFCYFGVAVVCGGEVCRTTLSSDSYGHDEEMAVRPVVSLKSNVTVNQVIPITGSEEVWDTTMIDGETTMFWDIEYGQIKATE